MTNLAFQNEKIKAALALARWGWYIFPSPKKNGNARVRWRLDQASSRDPATIIRWYSKWPDDLVYLDCGRSEVGVIDADTIAGHDVDGQATLDWLELVHGPLPPTLMASTPSGGRHRFFRDPLSKLKSTAGKLGPGLDTRGNKGALVLAPSIVKGKGCYSWINLADYRLDNLPLIPDWVLDICGAPSDHGPVPDAEFDPAYTEEEFTERLNLLRVEDFDAYDKWILLQLACTHSSTVADGKYPFIMWTTKNGEGDYAGDYDMISNQWDANFRNRNRNGPGVARVGTFNRFLIDAGHGAMTQFAPDTLEMAQAEFGRSLFTEADLGGLCTASREELKRINAEREAREAARQRYISQFGKLNEAHPHADTAAARQRRHEEQFGKATR